ncbi:CopD family protein [Halovenus rubra]|uniref:CopD family protein n=2 Tax=Halovenus rubra TaxID=869890 RepID=A0ABD5X5K5_9EURY|nr:CopD family protein [Halovenus rubra]
MEPIEIAAWVFHSLFSSVWTGSVLFLTLAVLPLARNGTLNATPLESVARKIKLISRTCAVVLLLTGGHMAGQQYTSESLFETKSGWLVLAMVTFWFFLMTTVEIGGAKLTDGTERDKVREPANNARPFFLTASLLAVLLLVTAGLISAQNLGYL